MVKQISWDGDQWMGYDDEETLALKLKYANNRCLGGTMIWSIDFDSGIGRFVSPQVRLLRTFNPTSSLITIDILPVGPIL